MFVFQFFARIKHRIFRHHRIFQPRVFARTVGAFLIVALLASVHGIFIHERNAKASLLEEFRPGFIIDDALFYDGNAMNEGQIQAFLNEKLPKCRIGTKGYEPGRETPQSRIAPDCLKGMRFHTVLKKADELCDQYKGGWDETAAEIIAKVGRACGISQKALLVLIQKESSLITDDWPTDKLYDQAVGYACPDFGPCSPKAAGFFNQIYGAARQFQNYKNNSSYFHYRAGQGADILYNPNRSCGTQSVYIENWATAGLYNYTPYVPNQAALRAEFSVGDDCSAYGNRNFFRFFRDWFESSYLLRGAIAEKYFSAKEQLGPPTISEVCGLIRNGCYQWFLRRTVHWSESTGAHSTGNGSAIQGLWRDSGWENSAFGYPVSEEEATNKDGGAVQRFEGRQIHWSPATGAHSTVEGGGIQRLWAQNGWEKGFFGYPVSEEKTGLARGGAWQAFEGRQVHWSPTTGAHSTVQNGGIQQLWAQNGWENGAFGYPLTEEKTGLARGGAWQAFEGRQVHWSPATGAHSTVQNGGIQQLWAQNGWENGVFGYPVSEEEATNKDGGAVQRFEGRQIHWSPATGAHSTVEGGGIQRLWAQNGWEKGFFGYPVSEEKTGLARGGVWQQFQGVRVYWSPSTQAHALLEDSPVFDFWQQSGAENGRFGYPTGEMIRVEGELVKQDFEHGTIFYSPSRGAYAENAQ